MTETLTAAGLLKTGNSDLLAFLSSWQEHREPPVPLIDWLMEHDLISQAEAVKWVLKQAPVTTYRKCKTEPDGPSLPFPVLEEWSNKLRWSWGCGGEKYYNEWNYFNADQVYWLPVVKGKDLTDHLTFNDAIVYLLDHYPGGDWP